MPEKYGNNTFLNRFKWSAIRNPRFNYNYTMLRSNKIIESFVEKDTRGVQQVFSSGIGYMKLGIIVKWFKDIYGDWYFIYESATKNRMFYIGWVGLLDGDVIGRVGRFEISLRIISKKDKIW